MFEQILKYVCCQILTSIGKRVDKYLYWKPIILNWRKFLWKIRPYVHWIVDISKNVYKNDISMVKNGCLWYPHHLPTIIRLSEFIHRLTWDPTTDWHTSYFNKNIYPDKIYYLNDYQTRKPKKDYYLQNFIHSYFDLFCFCIMAKYSMP